MPCLSIKSVLCFLAPLFRAAGKSVSRRLHRERLEYIRCNPCGSSAPCDAGRLSDISERKLIFLDISERVRYDASTDGGCLLVVEITVKKIGDKLCRTRESMGLTLQQLANLSDVAPSTIQKIEAGTMMPSVAVMMKIARGLRKKIGFFLDEEESSTQVSFVRKRDRLAAGLREEDFSVRSLTAELVSPEIDGFILTLPPGANSGDEPLHHRGEELVHCIRGRVTFTIDDDDYILRTGDSLHFKSDLPHFWRNSGRSRAELILVCSLPALSEESVFQGAPRGRPRAG
jgi:transcriptional regulator with XRE-family HTH domain